MEVRTLAVYIFLSILKASVQEVREGETIPYLVRIVNPTLHQQCNGILVSKNLVLTSAYCVNGSTPVSLYLGYSQDPRIDSLRVKENGQDFTSSDFIIHNNFKQPYAMKDYYEHDIAVVKLPRNAVLSDKVYEANLQGMSMEITFPEAAKLITFYRNKLKIVDANIQSGAVCSSEINTEFEAAYYQVGQHGCASLPADFGGYDHYGSPLVIGDNVIGFTTNNPSGKDNPALFVSITDFQIWIDFQVENNLPYPESASCCIVGWFVLISALQIIIIMFN